MGPGMFDGVGRFIEFSIWAIPILGIFALWKIVELVWWGFHHITIN